MESTAGVSCVFLLFSPISMCVSVPADGWVTGPLTLRDKINSLLTPQYKKTDIQQIQDHTWLAVWEDQSSTITGESSLMRPEVRPELRISHITEHYC